MASMLSSGNVSKIKSGGHERGVPVECFEGDAVDLLTTSKVLISYIYTCMYYVRGGSIHLARLPCTEQDFMFSVQENNRLADILNFCSNMDMTLAEK